MERWGPAAAHWGLDSLAVVGYWDHGDIAVARNRLVGGTGLIHHHKHELLGRVLPGNPDSPARHMRDPVDHAGSLQPAEVHNAQLQVFHCKSPGVVDSPAGHTLALGAHSLVDLDHIAGLVEDILGHLEQGKNNWMDTGCTGPTWLR